MYNKMYLMKMGDLDPKRLLLLFIGNSR